MRLRVGRGGRLAAAACVLALELTLAFPLAGTASAYETATAADARWPGGALTFHVNSPSFAVDGLGTAGVTASFEAWEQDALSTLTTTRGADTARVPAPDGFNDVAYENTFFAAGSSVLAVTALASAGSDLVEADLTINGVNFAWGDPLAGGCTSAFDLRGTVTHEAGHALGLGHSSESLATCDTGSGSFDVVTCEATMFFAGGACDATGQSLECDDRAGMRFLYPAGGTPRADWVAEGFGASPPPGSVSPGQLVTLTGTAGNRGSVLATAGTAALYVETSSGATTPANRVQTTSLLSTGSCRTRTVVLNTTFTAADAGTRWLVVKLDDADAAAEHSESDNVVSFGPYFVDAVVPRLALSAAALDFDGTVGGPAPSGQSVTVTNTGSGTFTWTATDDRSWISVAPGGGAPGASFLVSVDPSGLAAGTHAGTVTVTAAGAADSPRQVAVTFDLVQGPVLTVAPPSLSFAAPAGGALPASQQLDVGNAGGGALSWTASDDAAWLSVSPGAGSAGQSAGVSVTSTAMAPGQYSATVTIMAPGAQGSPKLVGVTLDLAAAAGLAPSPERLTFELRDGSAVGGSTRVVTIGGGAPGTLPWTARTTKPWLRVSPSSGTSGTGTTVSIAPGTVLPEGVHDAAVVFESAGAPNSPAPVPVIVVARTRELPSVHPQALELDAVAGQGPRAAGRLAVDDAGSSEGAWRIESAPTWLRAGATTGVSGAGTALDVDAASLPSGTIAGTLVVTSGNEQVAVPIELRVHGQPFLVAAPAAVELAVATGATSREEVVAVTNAGAAPSSFSASATQPWVRVTPSSATAPAQVRVSVQAAGLAPGAHGADLILRAGLAELRVPVRVAVVAAGAAVADFGASALEGCAPLTVAFQDLSAGSVSSWAWSFGDGTTSASRSPVHVFDRPGEHEVTLTAQGGGDRSIRRRRVIVRQPPLAHAGRDRTVAFEAGGTVRVSLADARAQAAAPARLVTVSWLTTRGTFADTGTTTSPLERPTLLLATGRASTSATVTLTAVDDTGCSSSDAALVTVLGDVDADLDARRDFDDSCPARANASQQDSDQDGLGDACDSCVAAWDPLGSDLDADGLGDACDPTSGRVLILAGGPARACDGTGRLRVDVTAPARTRRILLELIGPGEPVAARAVGPARSAGGTTPTNADPSVVELRVPAGVLAGRVLEVDVPVTGPGPSLTWSCGSATHHTAWGAGAAACGSAALTLRPDADVAPSTGPDGATTVGDVVRLLQASVGLVTLDADEQARGDVSPGNAIGLAWTATPDCAITVGDVIVALRASVGLIDL